jgi:peptidoglycan-N-acetylglucosamine deacetylase
MEDNYFPKNYWLDHKQAAISLTYDDGYVSNLDNAIPQLEIAGFRGTFYLHVSNPDVQGNIQRWKTAFQNGHDISNHSMSHLCGKQLIELTSEQLIYEVGGAEQWLIDNIGYDEYRSYAYPCTECLPNDKSFIDGSIMPENFSNVYRDLVHKTYMISRTGYGRVNNNIQKFADSNTHEIDANAILWNQPSTLAPFIDFCKSALNSGGWAVIAFHGIGDDKMTTDFAIHQELINYLKQNQDRYWVAPLKDVAKHIRENPVA